MTVIPAYLFVVGAAVVLSVVRTKPTIVRGNQVVRLNVLFFAGELIRIVWTSSTFSSPALVVLGIVGAASFPMRGWWLLNRFDDTGVRAAVEESLRQLRIDYVQETPGYTIRAKAVSGVVSLRSLPTGRGAMKVSADGPSPKIDLLRKLLTKRFERLVPRPHIRLR